MDVSGVRSSWETDERKTSFALSRLLSSLAYGSFDHFENGFRCLLSEQPVPYDVAGVIVEQQVDESGYGLAVRPGDFESVADVGMPQGAHVRRLPA